MTSTSQADTDRQAVDEFAGRLFELFTGAALSYLIDLGHRTGIFAALAAGPATSTALSERAGLQERYVREWLGAMASGGIVEYAPSTATFWLPHEHAASLVGDHAANLAPVAMLTTVLGHHVDRVAEAFRHGGGVPYADYLPELHDVMDALWGPLYRDLLVPEILPLAPGLPARLTAGARAADIACGTGNAVLALATAYPASTFVGYDLDGLALDRARDRAGRRGLTNVTFTEADAATLSAADPFDAVFVFNALHDQAAPAAVLDRIRAALVPEGVLLLDEPRLSSRLEDNMADPLAPFTYAISTLHCLTVSLAAGGAGLGTAFGEQTTLQLLSDAGFGPVAVHDAPGEPGNAVYVTHRPAGAGTVRQPAPTSRQVSRGGW